MHRPPGFRISGIIILILALSTGSCDGATEPSPSEQSPSEPPPVAVPVAARLIAATATSSAGTVGTELLPTPVVRATDAGGLAMARVPVTFQVGDDGGRITTTVATTNADGLASVGHWTLGPIAKAQTVTARATGVADVVFTATAAAGPVAQVHALSGGNQIGLPGEPLGTVLRVRVTDAFGNGIVGAPVTFTVTAGGGTIASESVAADSAGEAISGVWTLGPDSGSQQVRARSGTLSTVFSAFAIQPSSDLTGRLAFVSEFGGNSDIYTMNADGTGFQRLTTDPGADLQPAWAPAGDRLAFAATRNGSIGIYFMNADGSNVTGPIPSETYSMEPSWSPGANAAQLAYVSLEDGSGDDVVSIDTSTGAVSVLSAYPGYDGQPSWSPDGQRLAFVSDRDAYDFVFDIYTMNADGTGQQRITQGFDLGARGMRYYLHPTWSPDGTLIAFVWGEFLTPTLMRFHVAIMSPDGSGVRDLAWAGDIASSSLLDPGSLAWSPDGRNIAFTFAAKSNRSVKYVSLTGGEAVTLIPNGHSPSWR